MRAIVQMLLNIKQHKHTQYDNRLFLCYTLKDHLDNEDKKLNVNDVLSCDLVPGYIHISRNYCVERISKYQFECILIS